MTSRTRQSFENPPASKTKKAMKHLIFHVFILKITFNHEVKINRVRVKIYLVEILSIS